MGKRVLTSPQGSCCRHLPLSPDSDLIMLTVRTLELVCLNLDASDNGSPR